MIRITLRGRRFEAPFGAGRTVLEAALAAEVPLRYACRHADCGTCRVFVADPDGALAPPSEAERDCLERLGSGPDDRLACQARLIGASERLEVRLETEEPEAPED